MPMDVIFFRGRSRSRRRTPAVSWMIVGALQLARRASAFLLDVKEIPPLEVALAPGDVLSAVRASIGPEYWSPFSFSGYFGRVELFGAVSREGFRIQRRHVFASAFNPHLYGRVESIPGGSRINLRSQLHPIPRVQR